MSLLNWLRPVRSLREQGVLGLNQRNADYIFRYNPRKNFSLVDDKRRTKQLAASAGIPVPELYGVVEIVHQIDSLPVLLGGHEDFVIKPAHGSGGDGILVITGKLSDRYRKCNGRLLDESELGFHVSNILSGGYSLGGLPDCALIEYRVEFDPVFESVSFQGVPDIRTLVFKGIPVLAMIRLPTRLSMGRANLHQGAVGVGIELSSGVTYGGVWHEDAVDHHPDTGAAVAGIEIPHWNEILALAARCYDLTQMGYIGVDVVIDKHQGPLMLEINARPGLSIQLAGKLGVLRRLRYLESLSKLPESAEERVDLARWLSHQSNLPG